MLDAFTRLLAEEGVVIETGQPVERICRLAGGLAVETRSGARAFDRVVVTSAAPLAAKICQDLNEGERRRLEGVVYNGVICASVLLRRPLGGYYLTYITDPSIPFTAVIEMSALVDAERHFGGNTLVYLPRYVTGDDAFWTLSDEETEARFLEGLRKIY
ncbi:MAG: FAD-dependent oxidoreductase, partial [Bacteroidota bacterium]